MDALSDKLRVAFLDVGQGDTIVVSNSTTHEAIVIDCINANAVLDYLTQEKIKYLRGILITHLHSDHFSEVEFTPSASLYEPPPGIYLSCSALYLRHCA
jgi:beta-lactamase superfamily II metal-dependent hydrolase